MNNFMCLFRKSALVNDFPQDFTQNIELKGHITAVHQKNKKIELGSIWQKILLEDLI